MKTIEDLQELQSKLRVFTNEYGFLAGGCIRDFLFHTEPKDYDFVIPCKPSWGQGEVFAIMSRISGRLSELGYSSAVYAAYEDAVEDSAEYRNAGKDFQEMFLGCMKVDLDGMDVDILFSIYPSIDEHVSRHDCNINKVWLNMEGVQGYSQWLQPLTFTRDVGPERIAYMRDKYAALCATGCIEPRYE